MIALDTNLLVRLYVDDGDRESVRQRESVVSIFQQAPVLFVAKSVLLEFEWVLRGYYKFGREQIARAFSHLLGLANVAVEDETNVTDAIGFYRKGVDFADALHAASSSHCEALLTFDRRFAARSKRNGIKLPIVIAGRRSGK